MNLIDLSRPLAVLKELAAEFPLLPAPTIAVTTIYPNRLEMSFHDNFGDFEAWREALGIDPASVRHNLQSGDTTCVLHGTAVRDDVTVELIAYGPNVALPALAVAA
ncbi:hypothetical protein [Streptomyces sp. NPDC051994]|uniref:hypothetical protein n=1 Tax=unclassified Streptomyces TaxID=2593676 RepID=UPI003416B90D